MGLAEVGLEHAEVGVPDDPVVVDVERGGIYRRGSRGVGVGGFEFAEIDVEASNASDQEITDWTVRIR